MKNILTLSLSLSLALAAQAQLAPQTEAPLHRHMLEVNAHWAKAGPMLASDTEPVHFTNEAERITRHLHLVAGYLRAHSPEGLSADAATKRAVLLNDLEKYADRGLFPQNHVLPYRNPVFIDPQGTACAVGQLMIESGHRDLAESISQEMNLAYVHDMKRADVLQWAVQEGFTEDELAWIQPGYPPTIQWNALGGGTNGPVTVMLNLPNGNVLVAGMFTEAGGVPVENVALWNGGGYTALGDGVFGTISCGTVFGDDIYLGGYALGGYNDIAHWDGTEWTFSTVFDGKLPYSTALHVHSGEVYVAGMMSGFAGIDYRVARLTGGSWDLLPGNFTGEVKCLGSHDGQLVAGGGFDGVQIGDPVIQAQHVATLSTGGWTQLGDGLDGTVLTLLDMNGTLYAGGAMYANIVPLFGLARIPAGASNWELLMPNLANYIFDSPGPGEVRTLMTEGNEVYMGGAFNMALGMVNGQHLARFLGAPDSFEPLAYFNGPVDALAADPFISDAIGLYAGGEFTQNVGDTVPYVAGTILTTGMNELPENVGMALFPNPAHDRLTVTLDGPSDHVTLEIVDAQGRTVITRLLRDRSVILDVKQLATGAYTLRAVEENRIRSLPFVKR